MDPEGPRRFYHAPAFGQSIIRRSSSQRHNQPDAPDLESVSTIEDESDDRVGRRPSHASSRRSHLHVPHRHSHGESNSQSDAPLHDPSGKPIYRRGSETVGDLFLHPYKQLDRHRRRVQEYERQEKEWDEKAAARQQLRATPDLVLEEKPVIRTIVHFRHLTGDQHIRITKAIADQLAQPLDLTDAEILELYTLKDTDDLTEFFHKTKRDCSLKVHKGVNIKAAIASRKDHDTSPCDSPAPEPTTPENVEHAVTEKETTIINKEKPSTLTIDLNPNVYLEIKYTWPEKEDDESKKTRRPIFALPDPDLSDEVGEETSATWVELFGDVFYVGWLSTFTHENHIAGGNDLGRYAAWFVVMWWTWCASALYSSRYDTADVMHHIYKIIELCGLVGMAGASNDFWDHPKGFIIGYMVMKAVLLVEYSVVLWVAALSGSASRYPLSAYVGVNALSMILWGVSLLFQGPESFTIRFVLWYLSIFIEVIVNIILKRNKQVSLAASHLGERFGLFTIIILGENCMGFIKMVAESDSRIDVVIANMMGVVIIFSFFFMYFDDFSKEILNRVEMSQIWMYLHFPLHLCQVAFGIALTDIITVLQHGWDSSAHSCEHGATTVPEPTVNETSTAAHSLLSAMTMTAAVSAEGEAGECINPNYVYDAFWVSAGLILCINALIKLVNTPVWGARWSWIICSSRILNAIVFFALTAASFENFGGVLGIVSVLMACLLFQSAVDLLD